MDDQGFLQNASLHRRSSSARAALRRWYSEAARALPWRTSPSLYGTWLSEIMLQQTRVQTGIPKWHLFMELFPTVGDLAAASEDDVMKAWEGLGYYRRARLLHRAAKVIEEAKDFPDTHQGWLALPGVGPYTSAAIASIGLNVPVAAVDGNVQRVLSRWAGMSEPVDAPEGAKEIQRLADALLDTEHPGDHNQAVMELGALLCSPRSPKCHECPIVSDCSSANHPEAWERLPVKKKKKKATLWRLQWHIATFDDQVVALQRPSTGIWPTMWVFPESGPDAFSALGELHDPVTHLLTHRKIEAQFIGHRAPNMQALETYAQSVGGTTMSWEVLAQKARPRLMTKVFDELLSGLGSRE